MCWPRADDREQGRWRQRLVFQQQQKAFPDLVLAAGLAIPSAFMWPGRARHPPLFPFVLESSLHAIHPALSRSEATMGVHWVGVRNTGPGSWRGGQREAAHLLLPQITVQQGSEAPKFTARGRRAGVQEHQPAAEEGRGSPSVSTAEPVFPPWSFSLSSWGCGGPKEPRGLIRPGGNSSWS